MKPQAPLSLLEPDMSFSVPVALLVFNRPAQTARTFEAIRQLKPARLLVVADGPRAGNETDAANCPEVRRIVTDIDWPCDLQVNFADANMGCKERVNSGLSWVFEMAEEAIILEDDCLPDPTFFPYCRELLERYRHDERVMTISGDNFQFGQTPCPTSYYFSRHMHCWGWASWRRVWKLHDPAMPYWPELKQDGWIESFVADEAERHHWHQVLDAVYTGALNTWDYQFSYTILRNNGLNIHPAINLISNIGFDETGTHTTQSSPFANMATAPLPFPLVHPPHMVRNFYADDHYGRMAFRRARRFVW
jgi:hypothetical protein